MTITSPPSGSTVSGTTTVSASVSVIGSLTVAGVQFKLDGANLGAEDTSAPYAISWNTATASNGLHTLTAMARDLLGMRFTSNPVTVTVFNDTTPPTVSITSPTSGATVSGTIPVSASAADNVGVAGVQFRLDGANFGAEDTSAPYAVSWNTTMASNGSHTLTAVARDARGNKTTSAPVTVTVFNDTTPPTVSITSPASGATVGATIPVSASAADNIGVAGVQFRLDGANFGAEDTSAPYSVAWDTTTAGNGSHTLTAVARDARGNKTTSAPVTVAVFNGPPADTTPPTVAITAPADGTTVSGMVTLSASASDDIAVAGVQFFVDGTAVGAEDMTAPYSVEWDTAAVPNGFHSLTARARDTTGNTATSVPVRVTISNGPPATTRFEETDLSITYTINWIHGSTAKPWSAGTATVSTTAGMRATFSFTGTSAGWIGYRGPEAGIARVFVDGAMVADVDTFSATEEVQAVVFRAADLPAGSHTLTVEVTGLKNPASTNSVVVVDAFDVEPSSPLPTTGMRAEETGPAVGYTAGWTQVDTTRTWSGGTAAVSATPGARATFTFTGTSVSWVGFRQPQAGIARVFLDGALVAEVDTFAANPVHAVIFRATGLPAGSHTLTLEVTGLKNPASTNSVVVVDAFDIRSRFEETHPSITYTGSWALSVSRPWSDRTAVFTGVAGARATFTFTGTSVSWIGFRGAQTGIARVFLDGAFVGEVDTYSATEELQAVIFSAVGLTAGDHTLTIEVTGTQNPAATGSFILVDAFDVNF